MSNSLIEEYGWTAVPRKVETLLQQQSEASGPAKPMTVSSIKIPDSSLVKVIREYSRKELAIETFNHSMRVYYYGKFILRTFLCWTIYWESLKAKQSSLKRFPPGQLQLLMRPISWVVFSMILVPPTKTWAQRWCPSNSMAGFSH